MKVILTEEVYGLGEPGKVVDVAPGYARNFLVPRKLAEYVNPGKLRELEHNKRRLERKRQRLVAAAMSTSERLNNATVSMEAHAGPGGKLYGSVTTADIAEAIKQQFDIAVDRRKIHLGEPIRTIGDHPVTVQLMGEARATLTVHVFDPNLQAEAATAPAPAEPTAEEVEPEAATEEATE
jgi:large subunit ribosomal protein L9